MNRKAVFPIFNGVICAGLGAVVGYYLNQLAKGLFIGFLIGVLIGIIAEWLLGKLGDENWFYNRRVLLLVLVEIPLAVFIIGPYAYAVKETQPNQHAICCDTPLDYGAATYEDVRIETNDGITLAGWYVPPQEEHDAVIVLLHGAHGDRTGTSWFARQFIDAGYGVLLYDQRALGESTGEMISFGWLDGADLLTVVDYLANRPEVDPDRIGVVGLSGGGHIALNAAHIAPDRFGGMWLDGVQAQRIEDFPEAENNGEKFATVINGMMLVMAELHLRQQAPPSYTDILTKLEEPPLVLVAGGLDDFERRANQQYATVINENAEVWIIEDAWHVGGPSRIPDEYRQRMLVFFEDSLGE